MTGTRTLVARVPACDEEVCITCSDQLVTVRLEWVSEDGALARGSVAGSACEVNVELIDGAGPGDVVLAQAGVALQRAGATDEMRL